MTIMHTVLKSAIRNCLCLAGVVMSSGAISAQSRYAPIFEKFRSSGDRATILAEIRQAGRGIDIRVEWPFLLDVISFDADPRMRTLALGELYIQEALAGMAYLDPVRREIFRPAIPVLERHLDEAMNQDDSPWLGPILGLTAILGFPPSPGRLALIYKTVDNKNEQAQTLALHGLVQIKPLPREAKAILLSRLEKRPGKVSGLAVLGILAYAMEDPDVLQVYVKGAEAQDIEEQTLATQLLSNLNPIPQPAVDVFRRLQKRENLDEQVAANVRAATDRIENKE